MVLFISRFETQEVLSEPKKTFFNVKVTKHWNEFPRDVLESPFLGIFKKKHLDIVLSDQV